MEGSGSSGQPARKRRLAQPKMENQPGDHCAVAVVEMMYKARRADATERDNIAEHAATETLANTRANCEKKTAQFGEIPDRIAEFPRSSEHISLIT